MPEEEEAPDPNAKTCLVVGAILLASAWVLTAVVVFGLLIVLPEHQVDDYAWAVIAGGVAVAALATLVLIQEVF